MAEDAEVVTIRGGQTPEELRVARPILIHEIYGILPVSYIVWEEVESDDDVKVFRRKDLTA